MKWLSGITLEDVRAVYGGPEVELWRLIMGEQIHIGGLSSSRELADAASVVPGMDGVDLCCCDGAGMRFLLRFRAVGSMHGVDATEAMVARGRQLCAAQGLANRAAFTLGDVCESGLPDAVADLVWGEDAWCYVDRKDRLIREAVRLLRPGGTIAFTDWVEGPAGLEDDEAARFQRFMKFPSFAAVDDYVSLLRAASCRVEHAGHTGRFAPYADLYLDMILRQFTMDALAIIGYDEEVLAAIVGEMTFMRDLARDGKIDQGLFVARKCS